MALDSSQLNSSIQPDLKAEIISKLNQHMPPPSDPSLEAGPLAAFNESRDNLASALSEAIAKIVSEKVVNHIVSELEISGIEVTIPSSTFSMGAGTAAAPVTQPTVVPQSNNGKGRVS